MNLKNLSNIIILLLLLLSLNSKSQCPNDNNLYTNVSLTCPSSTTIPCMFGGEYIILQVTNGYTYTISTCNGGWWDTQLTLYSNLGGSVGYNDDFCGLQSEIIWTSTYTGNLYILLDLYNCMDLNNCMNVFISCCSPISPSSSDCLGAITICNNSSFSNNTNNTGCTQDLNFTNTGCLTTYERQGTWYIFSPINNGTLAFDIIPSNPLDDYDFSIWGPFPNGTTTYDICPPLGPPWRCSYSALSGNTGLDFISTDYSEGAGGDKWVRYLDVVAGEVYLMYIDNFSQSGLSFILNWNINNTASLNCIVLPIELIYFKGENYEDYNKIQWVCYENNEENTYYYLERSQDLITWDVIYIQPTREGNNIHEYSFNDRTWKKGINYYRLRYDVNNYSNVIDITNNIKVPWKLTNVLGQNVTQHYKGIVIEYYENYTIKTNYD